MLGVWLVVSSGLALGTEQSQAEQSEFLDRAEATAGVRKRLTLSAEEDGAGAGMFEPLVKTTDGRAPSPTKTRYRIGPGSVLWPP